MANEQKPPAPPAPEVKTTMSADEKRKADSAKVRVIVASGRVIAGDPDDPSKQRIYEEGESLEMPQAQADELRASGYVVIAR